VDNEEILALFSQSHWDDIDKESACSATKACKQVVGAYPDAGWVDRAAKVGYWFVAGRDDLVHVTGSHNDWIIVTQRPQWASSMVQLQG
jgi:hypothetical protein